MDYNADGIDDLLSGSYNGQLYVSLGTVEGFSPWTPLTDESGANLGLGKSLANGNQPLDPPQFEDNVDSSHLDSKSEFVTLFDWDQDGDLDLLIGSNGRVIYLRRNIGSRAEPAYGLTNEIPLGTDGNPLSIQGSHTVVEVGDWDGDGLLDLIASSASGAIYGFRNVTSEGGGEARFEPAEELISASNSFSKLNQRSGRFASTDLYDLNKDGKLDLIVGDYGGSVWYYEQQ